MGTVLLRLRRHCAVLLHSRCRLSVNCMSKMQQQPHCTACTMDSSIEAAALTA